jgi:hypothetical protein
MLGSLDGTSFAIETLRGVACFSVVFSLVRDFTESYLQHGQGKLYQAVLARQQRRGAFGCTPNHTTIAIDVQYYETYVRPLPAARDQDAEAGQPLGRRE